MRDAKALGIQIAKAEQSFGVLGRGTRKNGFLQAPESESVFFHKN
jgi:hypothetical protein